MAAFLSLSSPALGTLCFLGLQHHETRTERSPDKIVIGQAARYGCCSRKLSVSRVNGETKVGGAPTSCIFLSLSSIHTHTNIYISPVVAMGRRTALERNVGGTQ